MKNSGFNFDYSYLDLPPEFYTKLSPVAVKEPSMVILNKDLMQSLGLNFSDFDENQKAQLFSGNKVPEGALCFSQAYAGHQFSRFTMLGDGRAHVLGEHLTPDNKKVDIQFKGSGRTPYSRRGDGRAALGPMLREYIISEAMHALGIPTTRSLAVVQTGEKITREKDLKGAILTRVASSHLRVGTFEFAAAYCSNRSLQSLLDYAVNRHAPELNESHQKAQDFLKHVINQQIDLVVHWMRVGFIHGVMNTDNMTISGETIDYGPCAFMDSYDPDAVFSSIDHVGRYAFKNQPLMAQWNLTRFAEALLPLIDEDKDRAVDRASEVLQSFGSLYQERWINMMRAKLGLDGVHPEDEEIIKSLLIWMKEAKADYTNTFNDLLANKIRGSLGLSKWHDQWMQRLKKNSQPIHYDLMKYSNPCVIPRNHKVEEALEAGYAGDFNVLSQLISALRNPYTQSRETEGYQSPGNQVYQTFCGT